MECPWRLIISKNELSEWIFRKVTNASEHSHPITNNVGWPQEVYDKISQLARQKHLKTDEIRETIKLQFPHITWNDRRFLNYLKEEHKRSPQNSTTERVQRLIMASTRLCSVVAANEDWANCVEADLIKLLESYAQLTRVSAHQLDSMVDLELDMIHSEIEKSRRQSKPEENELPKKRKSMSMSKLTSESNDIQVMSIPSCTLYVRSQPLRSMSEPSSQNRRAFSDMITSSSSTGAMTQPPMMSFGVGSLFNLSSPVSSPSSTSSIQQRIDYSNTFHRNISNHSTTSGSTDMLQSPPITDSNMILPPTYGSSGGNNTGNGGSGHHHSNYNTNMYPMQTPYSAYNPSPSYTTQSGDMNFFDSSSMGNTSTYQHLSPSPAHMMVHRPQPATSASGASADRMATNYPNSVGYYPVRDTSSSSIQQRIMLQQEYEQHQRHLQQLESTRANNQLPIIRTNTGMHLVQQPNHSNLNSNTWS